MLHSKRKLEKSIVAPSAGAAPSTAAPAIPQSPGATPAAPPVAPSATPAAAAVLVAKPGPGRPPTRPHCLSCGKRIERCKCKDGATLPIEVTKAVEENKKKEVVPLGADEAEQILRFLVWGLGIVESSAAALMTKLTWDEAEDVYSFSEKDIEALLPPAHRVLAKHIAKLPSWIRDYRDEFQLAIVFYGIQKQKYQAAAEILAKKAPQMIPPAPASRPTIVETHEKAREASA